MTPSPIRMTSTMAERLFADTVPLLSTRQLTAQRLDMLRAHPTIEPAIACAIGIAADALAARDYSHPTLVRCLDAFNARCRH